MLDSVSSTSVKAIFLNLLIWVFLLVLLGLVQTFAYGPTPILPFRHLDVPSVLIVQLIVSTIYFIPTGYCAIRPNLKMLKFFSIVYGISLICSTVMLTALSIVGH